MIMTRDKLFLTVKIPNTEIDYNLAVGFAGYLTMGKAAGALLGFAVNLLPATEEVETVEDEPSGVVNDPILDEPHRWSGPG